MTARIEINESSQCAEARRTAIRLASEHGFDEVRAGQVGIVVTEACTNILKHAGSGEVLLHMSDPGLISEPPDFEMLAIDRGPGMDNLEKCLSDGYSTGGSAGEGLGAIQRLSDESEFYSRKGEGTVILARWKANHGRIIPESTCGLRVGGVNVPKRGEEACGDAWGVERSGGVFTIMVADGLGHGYEASMASGQAVRILREHRDVQPAMMIDFTHRALRSYRGAAVSVARVDPCAATVQFSGLGNVTAAIYSGSGKPQHLVSINGTAGHQITRIREFAYKWPERGILVMHSDGLTTGTNLDAKTGLASHDPALIAAVLYRDYSRGHDDATVVVAKAL